MVLQFRLLLILLLFTYFCATSARSSDGIGGARAGIGMEIHGEEQVALQQYATTAYMFWGQEVRGSTYGHALTSWTHLQVYAAHSRKTKHLSEHLTT